jgi:hypothetical protein
MGLTSKELAFDCWKEKEIFLLSISSRTALGPIQPSTQWVLGALSLEVKHQWCEGDHSLTSSAEVKTDGNFITHKSSIMVLN